METLDARGVGGARTVERRVFRRRVGRIVDRKRVLPDDFAACVDAIGDSCTDPGNGNIETGVLPVSEQESTLPAARDVKTDNVAARIDAFRPGLCSGLAGASPAGHSEATAVAGHWTSIGANVYCCAKA